MTQQVIEIGTISTPYNQLSDCPSNVDDKNGPLCELLLEPEYQQGIEGLKVGCQIDILYWLQDTKRDQISQVSVHRSDNNEPTGVFSLRSPNRPNPIGLAKLTIAEIGQGRIVVRGLDCLNGTMLVDIKPSITQ
ncbi:tRNA (N6-threonylcarbamoyladenosine(37)-N6)-methyltransferase TrmO [Vibrio sp. SCSIO 43137]|uniref:tRNA (N6-threonylcarbamoyladenosine(37)-N6)-methyltransferase TrmO n=1 Tax=Vibrio sp. SCSIO 43137 TaxID=3021011 RepID=UPI00230755DC|nr:tRNA (N6-threonylcarbamoyladenosine(37)-N6)-methyltransferase TrmO [Vibrio sp. SCSIO 43137]WCE32135.1 tRNA (N6-threonylcarbamoyladenosine(37)-N6)-methyltransferase TrmO [Vibrio sp. SCSIO 43137]